MHGQQNIKHFLGLNGLHSGYTCWRYLIIR